MHPLNVQLLIVVNDWRISKCFNEEQFSNDVHYDAKNENDDETDSDVTCSQDPIMLAFSKY